MKATTNIDKEDFLRKTEDAIKALDDIPTTHHHYIIDDILLSKLFILAAKGEHSIPISWLEEQAERFKRAHEAEVEENGFDAGRYYIQMYNAINTLIDTWESENG